MSYSLCPIALCSGPRDMSQYTYAMNYGKKCESVWYFWYIAGTQPKTIIDTGAFDPMMTKIGTVEAGLAKYGVKPDDIEIVIVTHLHNDHIAQSRLYKNAKFYVQKKELEYALNPHPLDALFYNRKFFDGLNIELVDGEDKVLPGISVFLTPGHTPGGQSVEIRTAAGKIIVAGLCAQAATFEVSDEMKKRKWTASAPIIHQDVRTAYDSVLAIRRRGGKIIAMHDPAYIGVNSIV
jgi:N-acyl homoserine lactone hydrolase